MYPGLRALSRSPCCAKQNTETTPPTLGSTTRKETLTNHHATCISTLLLWQSTKWYRGGENHTKTPHQEAESFLINLHTMAHAPNPAASIVPHGFTESKRHGTKCLVVEASSRENPSCPHHRPPPGTPPTWPNPTTSSTPCRSLRSLEK